MPEPESIIGTCLTCLWRDTESSIWRGRRKCEKITADWYLNPDDEDSETQAHIFPGTAHPALYVAPRFGCRLWAAAEDEMPNED